MFWHEAAIERTCFVLNMVEYAPLTSSELASLLTIILREHVWDQLICEHVGMGMGPAICGMGMGPVPAILNRCSD